MRHQQGWWCAAIALCASGSTAFAQCGGEPPSDAICGARFIPGTPGTVHIVMDVSNAMPDFDMACGFNVGHTVWFEVTPGLPGPVSVSTCTPETSFDTVMQIWQDSGDCEFPIRLDDLCSDDSPRAECMTPCDPFAPRGSEITFTADGISTYYIQVGAYNDDAAGCPLCLGLDVTICGGDSTPPIASITSPSAFGCICDGTQVVGSASDPDGTFASYTLEYQMLGGASWTLIANGTTEVDNGLLGTWDTTGLPEGYAYLRLRVQNACGLVSSTTVITRVDAVFDNLELRAPVDGGVYGGIVCFDGTAWDQSCFDRYTVQYRTMPSGSLNDVDPSSPIYTSTVINDPLASWDTLAMGIPDGDYSVQIDAWTDCGSSASATAFITIDNTPTTALITDPVPCQLIPNGLVPVFGTANDANLSSWVLQYTGGSSSGWVTIASGTSPVTGGLLGTWDTSSLPACAYTLRLIVSDEAVLNCNGAIHHNSGYDVSVDVGCGADLNRDGAVDVRDFFAFVSLFAAGCP